ncbi:MAG: hypothetical protein LBN38_03110 [Verrucomicrobiota bacterium]|jgi:hypothetical protein|nr:hypothetical protein [Verrucomicrobiota bacterium]
MKKALVIMAGLLVASTIAATAQEVLSQTAVGYIKRTLPADAKLITVAIPFNSMESTEVLFGETTLAQEAPAGSEVLFWDESRQSWAGGGKNAKGWGGVSNRVVRPGEAFFLRGPPRAAAQELTIAGEVPDETNLVRTVAGNASLSILGNPYPLDVAWGDLQIAKDAPSGSEVMFWDESRQSWSGGGKNAKGWGGTSNRTVSASEGFFLRLPRDDAAIDWRASKPYTWP